MIKVRFSGGIKENLYTRANNDDIEPYQTEQEGKV